MKAKKYWIKERYNPQLGIYFVACGQLSKTAAAIEGKAIYGRNTMFAYETEKEYLDRIKYLQEKLNKVRFAYQK